jgi:uncharacterized iron-regulated membrane protein
MRHFHAAEGLHGEFMQTALVVPAGATGSLQASHHEIDAALAPELHRVEPRTNRVSLDDIAARIEAGHPDLVVGYFLFTPDPGAAIRVIMNTRSAAHPGDPVAGVGRVESRAYCQVRFLPPGDIMDGGTIRLFVDGREGVLLGRFDHRDGTVGDRIRTWPFPLHSGQGFGLPGRILICGAGLLPLPLTGTGFWL